MPKARALYLHIPWGAGSAPGSAEAERFARAVQAEASLRRRSAPERETLVVSFAVGGGDPLSLPAGAMRSALLALAGSFSFFSGCERTCEADAGTLEARKLEILREAGFSRLCLTGLNGKRARLVCGALEKSREAGFGDLALDVPLGEEGGSILDESSIYGLGVCHVSLREPARAPLSEREWLRSYADRTDLLRRRGFERYEISHFARPGKRSRHLCLIQGGGETVGIGPGALTSIGPRRVRNWADPGAYAVRVLSGFPPVEEEEALDPEGIAREWILLGIRRANGVDLLALGKRLGLDLVSALAERVRRLRDGGFLDDTPGRVVLTEKGIRVADRVAFELLA